MKITLAPFADAYDSLSKKRTDTDAPVTNTLDTLIPVQLSDEDMKAFVKAFHPKRAAKAPQAFMEEAFYMAEVSAFVNSIFGGLRYGLGLAATGMPAASLGDVITKEIEVTYAASTELDSKAKDYMSNMAGGNHHIIRDSARYKGGKDIIYVGLKGPNVSPLLSSDHPVMSALPLLTASTSYTQNAEKFASDFGKAITETGWMIQDLFFNKEARNISSSYKRLMVQHQIGAKNTFVADVLAIFMKGPLAKLGIPVSLPTFKGVQTPHSVSRLSEFVSVLAMREPAHAAVMMKSRSKDLPDESLELCPEYQALQPDIRFSFVINMPQKFCEYITQTKDAQIPLVPLNTWANVWSAAMLRPPKTRSAKENRGQRDQGQRVLIPERAPKYVLRPSMSDELIERRKKLGLYSEKGRVSQDSIFITYNGDLAFMPNAEYSATDTAKEYEKLSEEALALSFEAGTPLAAGQRGSTGTVFDLAAPNYAEKISQLKDQLSKYKGSVQAINWDLNTVLTVSVSDPDRLVSTKLTGGSSPEDLNLATYLRSSFKQGMRDMFSRTRVSQEGRKFHITSETFADVAHGLVNSSVMQNFAHVYNHFEKLGKVPGLKALVAQAAQDMKVSDLGEEAFIDYELLATDPSRTIYKQIIGRDLSVMETGEKTGQALVALLGVVANQASARSGTNLARICIRDNIEFTEHDRYFDGSKSQVGEFARLYEWIGGRTFLNAVRAVLAIPKKDLMAVQSVEYDPTNLESGHPGFLSIVNEVMPMCVVFSKYVMPEIRDAIYERSDELKENENSFTEHDLNLAGSKAKDPNGKGGMKLFPHQAEALTRLKAHPKIAVLDIAPGGGKCLVGESLVPTTRGLLTLDECWQQSDEADNQNGFQRFVAGVVSHEDRVEYTDRAYRTSGKTRKVTLSDGVVVQGLPEHRLWAVGAEGQEFQRLDEITVGTWLRKSLGTNVYASATPTFKFGKRTLRLSEDLAELLGWYVSEGYVTDTALRFEQHEVENRKRFLEVGAVLFGDDVFTVKRSSPTTVKCSKDVADFLRSLMVVGTSAFKTVPLCIRSAPKRFQTAFLASLFEGDGSVYQKSAGAGKRKIWRVEYCTISKTLATQVKAILDNMGILSYIKEGKPYLSNGHDHVKRAYKLTISYRHIKEFEQTIGFLSERKRDLLRTAVAHVDWLEEEAVQSTNLEVGGLCNLVPVFDETTDLLSKIETTLAQFEYQVPKTATGAGGRIETWSLQKLLRDNGFSRRSTIPWYKHGATNKYAVRRVLRLVEVLPAEIKRKLLKDRTTVELIATLRSTLDSVWVHVTSNRAAATVPVFDLSVPGPHSYAVNGIYGHNTTIGIADIACLYADGLIRRPFVFAPNRLVKNWIEDLHKSFNGWNAIPVTTETYAEWGEERLTDLIKKAPPNTIVIVGNSFISNTGKVQLVIGNSVDNVSNAVEFCKKFEPDYVIIDESHRIRNPRAAIHQGIKTINQISSVKYGRIATGTLIQNVLSDVVGQSAIFNGQIFRTVDEFEEKHKGVVAIVNDKPVIDYLEDTPIKARQRLAEFATVISFKRKEWAFMLPMPVETFITVNMEEHGDQGHKLQQFYNAVLKQTLEDAKADPRLKKRKSEDEDDDGDEADADRKITTADGISLEVTDDDDDSDFNDELEQALQPYLQRLERLLTDPFGDPDLLEVAKSIFGEDFDENYVTPKVAKVIDRLKKHFVKEDWVKGKTYRASDLADFNGKSYIFKAELPYGTGEERSDLSPDSDTERWKPQIRGKVFIACRYTRSVDAIYRALPKEYQDMAVRFHGEVDNKDDNLNRFQKDDKVKILLGNEMGISEGHNFQMASRFIRVEAPWAPGELDQTASRIFRPDVGGEYTRQTIFLDWILCNNTLEVAKMGRLISKMLKRTKFDELYNTQYYKNLNPLNLPIIKMSLDNIRELHKIDDLCSVAGDGGFDSLHPHSYLGQYQYLVSEMGKEFREMRATKRAYMLDVEPTKMPEGSAVMEFTPWVSNMKVEDRHNDGLIPLKAAMEDGESELARQFKKNHKVLLGQFVRTEFGIGTITKVTTRRGTSAEEGSEEADTDEGNEISKVRVKLSQGGNVEMLSASKVYLATNITEKNKAKYNKSAPKITESDKNRTSKQRTKAEKVLQRVREKEQLAKKRAKAAPVSGKPVRKEVEEAGDKVVELFPVIYNGFLGLKALEEAGDRKLLHRFGFKPFGDYAFITIKNYQAFTGILDYLEDTYTLWPKTVRLLDSLHDSFQTGRGRKFQVELAPVSELPNFYQINHKTITKVTNKRKPELKIYPLIGSQGQLILVVDLKTNPQFRRSLNKTIPGVAGSKFEADFGMDICFFRTRTELVAKVKELRQVGGFTVSNLDSLKEDVAALTFIKRKD